jgi:SAM-dependent methyltransferase
LGPSVNLGGGFSPWLAPGMENLDAQLQEVDFNRAIPLATGKYWLVLCEQVIEHLHDPAQFLSECRRILVRDGSLILATESLSSLPNRLALLVGKAPFSLQPCCGRYYGGWKKGVVTPFKQVERTSPVWSGVNGHVRVLTPGQLRGLMIDAGFKVQAARSWFFGHYIMMHAIAV